MSIRHDSDHRSETLVQQPENCPALALGVVMEDGAGAAALERGQPRQAERVVSFFLVCPSPASHPVPTQMPGFKIKGLRWWMISLLMLGSIVNYLTRSTLAVARVTQQHEPAITPEQFILRHQVAHP